VKQKKQSFLTHLEHLRWHLISSFLAILMFSFICFVHIGIIFDRFIFSFLDPDFPTYKFLCFLSENFFSNDTICLSSVSIQIQNIDLAGQFNMSILVSLIGGLLLAFPYILWELWLFIKPAMYKNEVKYARFLVFSSLILFLIGILFGYYIMAPISLNFFANYQISEQIVNDINFISFVKLISKLIFICGFVFQLPVIIYFLGRFKLITSEKLKKWRKYAFIVILILASIVTPPDVFSQILISIPLFILYEISIVTISFIEKNDKV
jgi:sec-independent protein translocase protein TatC